MYINGLFCLTLYILIVLFNETVQLLIKQSLLPPCFLYTMHFKSFERLLLA